MEYSLLLIKPDAVRGGVNDEILEVLSKAGLRVMLRRQLYLTASQVEQLYSEHKDKDFFPHLKDFMTSGPCEVCIIEGDDAINRLNKLCGHNDPQKAEAGTLRRLYGTGKSENAVHSPSDRHSFYTELRLLLQVDGVSALFTKSK
ncbi:MAG TPA: nucleoside-diphosphate kinase [Pyrinomonadaceae bacterium]|nr:nucleoside-diphosphate kinase [Pyrinomonadaceae bacterium]